MLTIPQTIDSIFKRLVRRATLQTSVHIAARGKDFAVFAINCNDARSRTLMGRLAVQTIRYMDLDNYPQRYGFSTVGVKPKGHELIFCNASEVLVEIRWDS